MANRKLGSIHVPHHKYTAESESVRMPIPDYVVLPMAQHMGAPCQPLVGVGDTVEVGQRIGDNTDAFLTSPIFSSVSGKVLDIVDIINILGVSNKALMIETDGKQTVHAGVKPPVVTTHKEFVSAMRDCGLVGLGGAGFPTNIKLNPKSLDDVDVLVINGAECEPYITCDMRMMLERTGDVMDGISAVMKYMEIKKCVIAVEDNKPAAIKRLSEACKGMEGVSVLPMKATYPKGAEKVIIYETTGRVVGEGKLPADVGVIVLNTATTAKIAEYLRTGMPLVEKLITVSGPAISEPKNVVVPIGARIEDIIAFCGGYKCPPRKILLGGPMMGISVVDDSYPIVKNNNAILAFGEDATQDLPETACIRCGRCVRTCPINLMPAALDRAYHHKDIDALKELKVNLCMECGCCSYVCPAKRHLVMYNKMSKQLLREQVKK